MLVYGSVGAYWVWGSGISDGIINGLFPIHRASFFSGTGVTELMTFTILLGPLRLRTLIVATIKQLISTISTFFALYHVCVCTYT